MTSRSLTLTESRARAALLDVRSYDVHLDLRERHDGSFRSTTVVRFAAREAGAATFIELADASAVRAELNGVELPAAAYDGRLALHGLAEHNELVVEARLPYVTNGDGMHRFTDPADGETYVSAYCGMDIASRVFACFDQPELKATISLTVDADPQWTVLANARCTLSGDGRWTFAATPPLSTYLFVVCAGPWHSVTFEHRGLPFGWHARRSLAAELDRDAAELQAVTTAAFDHYTEIFDEPYGFDSYDQVMAPEQNWGALETPGCVTFRDEMLFRGAPSEMQRQGRATVICHEMAHMWFGDLVTMRWWEDSWLNESFADYMGYQVAGTISGSPDSWIEATLRRKPSGYRADGRRSTHPVAEDTEAVVDVDTAFANFDMITYAKGNAVLCQLVTWLGADTFLAGANRYLSRHRWGNADLADFLDALDSVSDRDVRRWADVWLRRSGFDTIDVTREDYVPVLQRHGIRPHRCTVSAYDDQGGVVGNRLVDLGDAPVMLPQFRGHPVVVNAGDETFARIRLDNQSWDLVSDRLSRVEDPVTRGLLWATAFDMARTGDLPVGELLALAARHLPNERQAAVFEGALVALTSHLTQPWVSPAQLTEGRDVVAAVCSLARHRHPVAATRAFTRSTTDRDLLDEWLGTGETDLGAALDRDQRWDVVRRLVELGADPEVIDTELFADSSAQGGLAALTARAAIPTAEAKEAAWQRAWGGEPSNREFEATHAGFWAPGQHALVDGYLSRYLEAGPEVARRRGQAFSGVVGDAFPVLPLPREDLWALRCQLAGALQDESVPTVLRREWEDRLDDLDAALAVRAGVTTRGR